MRRGWRTVAVVTTALFTGASWTVVVLARLFHNGTIGMADNGDGRRLLCQLGVRSLHPFGADTTKYVYTTYVPHRWFGEACGADGSGEPYRSSQVALLRLAKVLTRPLGFPGALDLRVLGIICAVVVGLAVAALVLVLPGPVPVRVIMASLVGLVAADASVAEYFVSPYSEPAALLGIMVLLAALLWLWRDGESTWPRLAVVAGVGVFTMTAKTQTVALLPAIALALLWLPFRKTAEPPDEEPDVKWQRVHMSSRPGPLLGLVRGVGARLPAILVVAMVTVASVLYLRTTPRRFSEVNAYNQVFGEILPNGHNPAGDLRQLGVDPALASASKSTIIDNNSAARKLSYLQFRDKVTQLQLLQFYVTHPDRLGRLAQQGVRGIGVWREDYLGTYPPGTGHPAGARECRICAYTTAFSLTKRKPVLVPTVWLLTLFVGFIVMRGRRLHPAGRALGRLAIFLVIAAVSELAAVMLSEGMSDLYKHLIFTNFLTALCLPVTFGAVLVRALHGGGIEAEEPAPVFTLPERPLFPGLRTDEESAV